MLVDFDHDRVVFPVEIISHPQRPDMVLWSLSSRRVVLIELTCPAEEGVDNAHKKKERKYQELLRLLEGAGWDAVLRPIEVGARGCVARSTPRLLRELGFHTREVSTVCRILATVVVRCSFTIYLASSSSGWQAPALITMGVGEPSSLTSN